MKKTYANIYCGHFAKIMSNYSIVGVSIMIAILLGTLVSALWYALAFCIVFIVVIFSIGMVFIASPNFIPNLLNSGDGMMTFITSCYVAYPYLFGITIATSVTSLVFLCVKKDKKPIGRIVLTSIIIAITLALGIVYFCGGMGKWKH